MEFDYDSGEICSEIENPLPSHHSPQTPGLSHSVKKLDMYYFLEETKRWQKYENTYSSVKGQTKLTFLTWNLWYGSFFFEHRINEVARIIEENSPDVVSLQQVTPSMVRLLEKVAFLRNNYYFTDIDGTTVTPIGVLILAKFPLSNISLRPLISNSGRELLLATFRVNKSDITIAAACLESRQRSADMRLSQAESMNRKLSSGENVFLMLNANCWGDKEREDILKSFPEMQDSWSKVNPDLKGYTIDTTNNAMINNQIAFRHGRSQARHDRADFVLYKGPHWNPTSAKIVGNTHISSIFPKKVDGQTLESRMENLQKDSAPKEDDGTQDEAKDSINVKTPPRAVTFYSNPATSPRGERPVLVERVVNPLSYSMDSIYTPKRLKQNLGLIFPSNHFGVLAEFEQVGGLVSRAGSRMNLSSSFSSSQH